MYVRHQGIVDNVELRCSLRCISITLAAIVWLTSVYGITYQIGPFAAVQYETFEAHWEPDKRIICPELRDHVKWGSDVTEQSLRFRFVLFSAL